MLNRFDSDRKMMSVIVKYEGKIYCLYKGAENVMIEKSADKNIFP